MIFIVKVRGTKGESEMKRDKGRKVVCILMSMLIVLSGISCFIPMQVRAGSIVLEKENRPMDNSIASNALNNGTSVYIESIYTIPINSMSGIEARNSDLVQVTNVENASIGASNVRWLRANQWDWTTVRIQTFDVGGFQILGRPSWVDVGWLYNTNRCITYWIQANSCNPSSRDREGMVNFWRRNHRTQMNEFVNVRVIQVGANLSLSVRGERIVDWNARNIALTIRSNRSWTVRSNSPTWLTVGGWAQTPGWFNWNTQVRITQNNGQQRTGTISLWGGNFNDTLRIVQRRR